MTPLAKVIMSGRTSGQRSMPYQVPNRPNPQITLSKAATRSGPTRSISAARAGNESNATDEVCGTSGPQLLVLASIPPMLVPNPCVPW